MSKRKAGILMLITVLFVLLAVCGTVFAYMFKQTEYKDNQFTPAEVSCEVLEAFDGAQKSSIQVKNTGNIDAYLRLRFVSYWIQINENGDAEIVGKASEMPTISFNTSNWIQGSNNTYYYKSPVAPGTLTEELLTSSIILAEEDGCKQVVEVFAEAIQSLPADAVTSSWIVTLDASGNISAAP